MATILMGWELGGGFGHVSRLVQLDEAFRAHGHRTVFAIRNLVETAAHWSTAGVLTVPAPIPNLVRRGPDGRPPTTAAFGDILALFGLDDPNRTTALLRSWDSLIDLVKPDMVLCDHSPLLCIAARGRIPAAVFGNGFTVPPWQTETFPLLIPNQAHLVEESVLLESFNAAQAARGGQPFAHLPEILKGDARFVSSPSFLDPYEAWRREPVVAFLDGLPDQVPPPPSPRVYAYMGAEIPGVVQVVEGIIESGLPADIYVRAASPAQLDRWERPHVRLHRSPPDQWDMLAKCSVAVHYGGLATVGAIIATGRPQIAILVGHLERLLNSQLGIRNGLGIALRKGFTTRTVSTALRKLHDEPEWMQRAQAQAGAISADERSHGLTRVIEGCLEMIG